MKKIVSPIFVMLALLLVACSSAATGTAIGSTSTDLPIETQIAVGTLKLSGTAQEISVDQAKELVMYWEVYKDLSQSETAAQAELDGLTSQIQETMTADQMQAISEMNLTQQDVFASMQNVTVASSNSSGNTVSLLSSSGSSSGGGMPAGGPPADGGGAPPDGGMSPDMGGAVPTSGSSQTQNVQSSSSTVSAEVPVSLVEAVIQALQQKIAA